MKEGGEFVYRDITAKNDISVELKDEELTIFDHIEDVWYSAQDEELGLTIKN